jgi:membrane protease YdiL (CAAX protease family)
LELDLTSSLPPPLSGTAVLLTTERRRPSTVPTLPVVAAVGAVLVLAGSLIVSKYLLDVVIDLQWPIAVYVALLAVVGYAPSVWWCRYVSRRWGTGRLGYDIGLQPQWSDLGWGPVVWLGALAAQVAAAAVVVALDLPISSNTEAINEASIDRTYVVSLVITAVIAAPIVEEMVFRGVVLRGLRSRLPAVLAVALQGLLFGAAHVDPVRGAGNVGLVMVLSGVGIAFGIASHLLRRIGPSIVAHALFNAAVLVVVLTGVADRLQDVSSAREGVEVVDQPHVAEASSDGDSVPIGRAVRVDDGPYDVERLGVDDVHIVE